jgi:cob(I)alamin adenosyltransferase
VSKGQKITVVSIEEGHKGFTKLLDGKRVPKYHLRPETYGTIDELNSFLGMARAVTKDKTVKKILFSIQNHLFVIGSDLALSGKDRSALKGEITQKEVDWLVLLARDFKTKVKPDSKFIIYGETLVSSILDVARAITRRAERQLAKMKSKRILDNLKLLEYLNYLSGLLYFIARYEEKRAKAKLKHPDYNLSTQVKRPHT